MAATISVQKNSRDHRGNCSCVFVRFLVSNRPVSVRDKKHRPGASHIQNNGGLEEDKLEKKRLLEELKNFAPGFQRANERSLLDSPSLIPLLPLHMCPLRGLGIVGFSDTSSIVFLGGRGVYQLCAAWELHCTYLQCVACTCVQQPFISSSVILSTSIAAPRQKKRVGQRAVNHNISTSASTVRGPHFKVSS